MTKILIIDDQACIRRLVSDVLIANGYEVQAVGDAQSVNERLASFQPDLVLLDLYLDGPDGFDLLKDIKRKQPKLPVIIMTAYDSYGGDPRLSEADRYMIKGLNFCEDVIEAIEEILNPAEFPRTGVDTDTASSIQFCRGSVI